MIEGVESSGPERQGLLLGFDCASAQGPKEDNEDVVNGHVPGAVLRDSRGAAAVVADGMSGGFGKTAALASVRGFLSDYYSTPDSWSVQHAGQRVLAAINSWIFSQGQQTQGGAHMGCTFTAVIFKSATAHVFHVGDSRAYRLREGHLEQMTFDHRMARSDGRSYLNRAIGIEPAVEVDYREWDLLEGDLYLLCSDGVHDFLSDVQIRELLCSVKAEDMPAGKMKTQQRSIAKALVDQALAHGGLDNASCALIAVKSLGLASADEYYRSLSDRPFPPELEEGMAFDGFDVVRQLYASSRSQVYLARDQDSDTEVVLKTPSVNYEDDLNYIEQFVLEEWVGRRINNSRVLKICPPKRRLHYLYQVTEYIDGQTLRDWMDRHTRPPIEDVQNIVRQVARGLQAFHRLEMVHRDLKPENLMIDREGQVKLIDFGSTYVAGLDELAVPLDRSHLVGTEQYTAPEFHTGHVGSSASDIYSLGTIAYEMLTGDLPYGDKPPKHPGSCKARYRSASHVNPMVPTWLDGALEKAVRCSPRERYGELSEFVQDLTHPNPLFQRNERPPLIERNPVRVWQGISALLLLMLLLSLWSR